MSYPYSARLDRLREGLDRAGLDAFLVTNLQNLRYLTGLSASAGAMVVMRARCILGVDFRYREAADQALAGRPAGEVVVEVVNGSLDAWLAETLAAARPARTGIEADSLVVGRFNRLSSALAAAGLLPTEGTAPPPALVPTERTVEALRLVKDASEAATLREAAARLSAIARELPDLAQPGRTERAVAADIESRLRAAGFDRPAFETIVASGPNGALPHARPGGRLLAPGEAVVLDFGGVYDGYCVDLTRTVLLGDPPAALRRMFAAVAEAHAAALGAVRPGVLPSRIDAAARDVLARHGLAEAFGHATGHGLGLDVHEAPRIGRELPGQHETPVEPGMVFTIEPGAYVPGLGGVRIEDDVLVTATGCEVLTRVPIELGPPARG